MVVSVNLGTTPYTVTADDAAATGQAQGTVASGTALDGFGDTDTLSSIDKERGSQHNDILIGQLDGANGDGGASQYLEGFAGNDTLIGAANVFADYYDNANFGAEKGVNANLEAGTADDGFGDT